MWHTVPLNDICAQRILQQKSLFFEKFSKRRIGRKFSVLENFCRKIFMKVFQKNNQFFFLRIQKLAITLHSIRVNHADKTSFIFIYM